MWSWATLLHAHVQTVQTVGISKKDGHCLLHQEDAGCSEQMSVNWQQQLHACRGYCRSMLSAGRVLNPRFCLSFSLAHSLNGTAQPL